MPLKLTFASQNHDRVRALTKVRPLFDDAEPIERDYFRRTGVFPIMHLVVIRRDIYEQNRWLARALYDAFKQAKQAKFVGWVELLRNPSLGCTGGDGFRQ